MKTYKVKVTRTQEAIIEVKADHPVEAACKAECLSATNKIEKYHTTMIKTQALGTTKPTKKEIIKQLESLKENSESFQEKDEEESIWEKDVEILETVIDFIEENYEE